METILMKIPYHMARSSPKFSKYFKLKDRINYGLNYSKYLSSSSIRKVKSSK